MKILSLRFQNLNSLEGEWFIDFTHPDYAEGGIFAITGPTGSGKTTILDAICLALYGRTPRLGKLTENFNEIMSRRQGECASELTFECAGGRFRAHWSQRRARKKPGAKLQEPRHEIADASGRVIESARSRTELEIVKICGMSFDQFTRSILLAQGEFAKFLEAPVEDRAGLLEQISGTEIYSRISMKVHFRKNEEWEKLRLVEQELAQCPALPEDDAEALKKQRETVRAELVVLDKLLAASREAADRLEKTAALEKRAAELELLQKPAETAAGEAAARLEEGVTRVKAAREAESAARPAINQARELDVRIGQLARQLKPLEAERTKFLSELEFYEKNAERFKKELARAGEEEKKLTGLLVAERGEEAEAQETMLRLRLSSEILRTLRADLRDGVPCPLCGATEHQHSANGNAAHADFEPQQVAETVAIFTAKKNKRAATEARLAAVTKSLQKFERDLATGQISAQKTGEAATRLKSESAALGAEQARLFSARREVLGSDSPTAREAQLTRAIQAAEAESARLEAGHKAKVREAEDLKSKLSEVFRNLTALAKEANGPLEKPIAQLREEIAALSGQRDRLQATLGVIEQKIKEHSEAARANKALLERRTRQKAEFDRWNRLHELIGSADGKKYRHFAQGLTFEVMMAQANRWLSQMNDRYLLIRDVREPLELSVIDNYQAGEIRSTKNLSGGERFIVSLALALGLSKMAGQNVRVDSLFLDEGFGTLDEDSLDTALEALSGLREHGKLIGVISHVPALTDRIPVQIKVTKLPGGRAILNAPGGQQEQGELF